MTVAFQGFSGYHDTSRVNELYVLLNFNFVQTANDKDIVRGNIKNVLQKKMNAEKQTLQSFFLANLTPMTSMPERKTEIDTVL